MLEISIPPSKSCTQRALVLAALSPRSCRVQNPLDCDDSQAMLSGLRALGVVVDIGENCWTVQPPGAFHLPKGPLVLGNAGTAVRFLTGLAPLIPGCYTVDGNPAMRRRPMSSLLDALRSLEVEVEELGHPGCPPVRLKNVGNPRGGQGGLSVRLRAKGSSQEVSALLLLGAGMPNGLEIVVEGTIPSRSYVDVTLHLLRKFGIGVERTGRGSLVVSAGPPGADSYWVEGDWTSASYALAGSWLTGKEIQLHGLSKDSDQGDRVMPEILKKLSAPGPRSMDLGDTPDLVPTVVACALFSEGETEIYNVAHLRIKESDRIGGLCHELAKLGADLVEKPDGLVVRPRSLTGPANLDPAADHRLAMAFGLVSLRVADVTIGDRECVSKSYSTFWEMLETFR